MIVWYSQERINIVSIVQAILDNILPTKYDFLNTYNIPVKSITRKSLLRYAMLIFLVFCYAYAKNCECIHGECSFGFCLCEDDWSGLKCDQPVCKETCINGMIQY